MVLEVLALFEYTEFAWNSFSRSFHCQKLFRIEVAEVEMRKSIEWCCTLTYPTKATLILIHTFSLIQMAVRQPPRMTLVSSSYGFAFLASFSTA